MDSTLDLLVLVFTAIICLPLMVLALQLLLSLLPRRTLQLGDLRDPVTILIPAHSEELILPETLRLLLPHLGADDRVLVVADNCSDSTAEVARGFGVGVVERSSIDQRGKGYALAYGLENLAASPPKWIIVFDADCRWVGDGLDRLIRTATQTGEVCQGAYVIAPSLKVGTKQQISNFAYMVKNLARAQGWSRIGGSCQIFGSGVIFPWAALHKADLASGEIVEDMKLGIDLAIEGHYARFVPDVMSESDGAPSTEATSGQRTRWEQGHLRSIVRFAPRLLWAALRKFRPKLLLLALDLIVPPLTFLLILATGWMAICLILWQTELIRPLALICTLSLVGLVSLSLTAVWLKFGRRYVSVGSLLRVPAYMAWKLPIYARLLMRRGLTNWNRTARVPDSFRAEDQTEDSLHAK